MVQHDEVAARRADWSRRRHPPFADNKEAGYAFGLRPALGLELCNTARLQKGGFHMAILSEFRRGRHAPNVRSTALGGN
jgi:hypothetical protein